MVEYYSNHDPDPEFDTRHLVGLVIGLLLGLLLCSLFSSCKTKYVTQTVAVPEYHNVYIHDTDTLLHTDTLLQRDSIFQWDSIFCSVRGDTISTDRFHTIYKEHTVYRSKADTVHTTDTLLSVDTIPCIVHITDTITKQVPASPTFLQKAEFGLKGALIFALLAVLGYILYKFRTPIKSFVKSIIKIYFR